MNGTCNPSVGCRRRIPRDERKRRCRRHVKTVSDLHLLLLSNDTTQNSTRLSFFELSQALQKTKWRGYQCIDEGGIVSRVSTSKTILFECTESTGQLVKIPRGSVFADDKCDVEEPLRRRTSAAAGPRSCLADFAFFGFS
jgi:hypothetical protein